MPFANVAHWPVEADPDEPPVRIRPKDSVASAKSHRSPIDAPKHLSHYREAPPQKPHPRLPSRHAEPIQPMPLVPNCRPDGALNVPDTLRSCFARGHLRPHRKSKSERPSVGDLA